MTTRHHASEEVMRRAQLGGRLTPGRRPAILVANGELGGTNDTACHLDIPMRNCSLYLDDEPIVVDGDIVVADMQAPRWG